MPYYQSHLWDLSSLEHYFTLSHSILRSSDPQISCSRYPIPITEYLSKFCTCPYQLCAACWETIIQHFSTRPYHVTSALITTWGSGYRHTALPTTQGLGWYCSYPLFFILAPLEVWWPFSDHHPLLLAIVFWSFFHQWSFLCHTIAQLSCLDCFNGKPSSCFLST